MPFVYSTATASTDFCFYKPSKDLDQIERRITIKGGANLVDRKTLITPEGACTQVTQEELDELLKHSQFNDAVEAGFYKITKNNPDIDKAVKDMEEKDLSAPITADHPIFDGEDAVKPRS